MGDPKNEPVDRSPTEELATRRRARAAATKGATLAGASSLSPLDLRLDRLTGATDDVADQVAGLRVDVRNLVTVETRRLEASQAFRKALVERILDPKTLALLVVLVLALAALAVGVPIAVGDYVQIGDQAEEAKRAGE